MSNEKILDVSWETILKIVFTLLCFYILYLIRDILIWFIFALIISVLFNPAINFLQRLRIPRSLAVIFIYVGVFGISSFLVYFTIPSFGVEIQKFFNEFPQYFEKTAPFLEGLGAETFKDIATFKKTIEGWVTRDILDIFKSVATIFGGIFSAVTIFTLAIFLSLEEKMVEKSLSLLFPKKYEVYVLNLWEKCQKRIAGWFGVRILACIFVGVLTFIACYVLGINYKVSFGILGGFLNIVPIIGPIVMGIIIIIFTTLSYSFGKALLLLIAFLLIQLVENNILTPVLTKKFVGLPPVLVLIALLIGGKLWGILGAILAIPLAGMLFEFLRDFLKKRKESGFSLKNFSQKVITM